MQLAVNLVARGVNDGRLQLPQPNAFQHIERAEDIGLEIPLRVAHRGGHRHLPGQVKQRVRPDLFDQPVHIAEDANVAMNELDAPQRKQPAEIVGGAKPPQVVQKRHLPPLLAQPGRDIAADKPAPAGYQGFALHR